MISLEVIYVLTLAGLRVFQGLDGMMFTMMVVVVNSQKITVAISKPFFVVFGPIQNDINNQQEIYQ